MSNKYDSVTPIEIFVMVLVVLMLAFSFVVVPTYESRSFNRLCGGDTTYWDALFTQLRVDGTCVNRPTEYEPQ